jgi:hypothetical protein
MKEAEKESLTNNDEGAQSNDENEQIEREQDEVENYPFYPDFEGKSKEFKEFCYQFVYAYGDTDLTWMSSKDWDDAYENYLMKE